MKTGKARIQDLLVGGSELSAETFVESVTNGEEGVGMIVVIEE